MSPATITKLAPHGKQAGTTDRAHDRSPKLVLHKPSGIFQYVYYPEPASATRRFKSTGAKTLTDAKAWAERERDRLGSVRRGHESEPTAAQARVTIGELFPLLVDDYIEHKQSSLRSVRSLLTRHLIPAFGPLRADALTLPHVLDARKAWIADGCAHASVNRYISALSHTLALAAERNKIARLPGFKFPMYNEDDAVRDEIVTDAELYAVNAAEPWAAARDFNTWAFRTGMRHGEIAKLAWHWFDAATWTITVPRTITKTKKPRVLPIPEEMPELREILTRRWADRRPDCPLIFHHDGESLKNPRWAAAWTRAGLPIERSGIRYRIPAKRFHDLRATAIVTMIEAGIPEKTIMLISGHRSRRIFDRHYNRMQTPHVRAAFVQLGQHLSGRRPAAKMPALMRLAVPARASRSMPARRAPRNAAGRRRAGVA